MIDRALAFVASTGAQSASAKPSSAAPSKNGREEPGFAEALAQSAGQTGANAESAPAREHPAVAPDRDAEKSDDSQSSPGDAADGVNLAALIALAAAESQRAPVRAAGKHAAGASAVTPDMRSASGGSAGISASGPVARGAVKTLAFAGDEDAGFAGLLGQSTESPGARAQSATVRELSSIVPGATAGQEDKTGTARASAAGDVDALIALAAAKTLPAGLPIEGKPAADIAGIKVNAPSAAVAPAGATPSDPAARGTDHALTIADPANAPPGLTLASDQSSAPGQVAANVQAAGTDRKAGRAQASDAATGEVPRGGRAADNTGSALTREARSVEFGDRGASQKTDELRQLASRDAETGPVMNLATGGTAHAGGTHGMASAGPAATLLVPTPVESPGWSKDFCQNVIRLAVEGQPAVEIHLNPPDWGPIRVSIEIKGQDATLQFVAAHPQTREALEGALPQLREMFAADSLNLAGANVTGQSSSQHFSGAQGQRFDPPAAASNHRSLAAEDAVPASIAVTRPRAGHSRVDLFA